MPAFLFRIWLFFKGGKAFAEFVKKRI